MRPEFCSLMATEGRAVVLEMVDRALEAMRWWLGAIWPARVRADMARAEEAIVCAGSSMEDVKGSKQATQRQKKSRGLGRGGRRRRSLEDERREKSGEKNSGSEGIQKRWSTLGSGISRKGDVAVVREAWTLDSAVQYLGWEVIGWARGTGDGEWPKAASQGDTELLGGRQSGRCRCRRHCHSLLSFVARTLKGQRELFWRIYFR
jgi:hypothetical protein